MRALRFHQYGPPSVLALEDIDAPAPAADEVLVEVHASPVNPSDVKMVSGIFEPSLPRTPGRDYAGIVVSGDARWKGKAVWGSGAGFGVHRDGAHAELVAVPSSWLSEKPSGLAMDEAATIGVPYIVAWAALVDAATLQAGETVLVTGAMGSVGRAARQIARWKGARVIGADITNHGSSPSPDEAFVDTRAHDLVAEVKALTDGRGADVVLDVVGGPLFELALRSLALGGRQIVIASVGQRRVGLDLVDFYHQRQRLIGVDTAKLEGHELAAIMNALRVGFEEGRLEASPRKRWPLERAPEVYAAVANGDTSARHVLVPR
jgi:NADPH:quinone reductase